jgi:hypothetical protein
MDQLRNSSKYLPNAAEPEPDKTEHLLKFLRRKIEFAIRGKGDNFAFLE